MRLLCYVLPQSEQRVAVECQLKEDACEKAEKVGVCHLISVRLTVDLLHSHFRINPHFKLPVLSYIIVPLCSIHSL